MLFYITGNRSEADHILRHRVLPAINRPENLLRAPLLPAHARGDAAVVTTRPGACCWLIPPVDTSAAAGVISS